MHLHEIGHAYDHVSGYPSKSAAFVAAHNADRATLGPYYTQSGDAGLSEAYAESFAAYHSANLAYRRNHPNLWQYQSGGTAPGVAPRRSFWNKLGGLFRRSR
jgi:hypothetical protein